MNSKIKIVRKDGIEYTRKPKEINYDCKINIRWFTEQYGKLKHIADEKGIGYQKLIRNILDEYINDNEWK